MKGVFAILHEPASYTTARNRAVYEPLGVRYCYIQPSALAKSAEDEREQAFALSTLPLIALTRKIREILRDNDIIIMNGYTGRIFRILFALNIFYGKKIGLDSDTPLNIPASPLKRLAKSLYLGSVFRNRNIYGLPGGTKSHAELFRHYGMPDSRIFLMPMMVDNVAFRFSPRKASKKSFTFLYVGRVVTVKNIGLLLYAFAETFGSSNDVSLRIVGAGDLLDTYKEQFGHFDNIVFVGPKHGEDLRDEYGSASAFVLPSIFEPWGLVVNEAMAAGLPVIVSDKVGAREDLVEGRETGLIFRHGNQEELADCMKSLVDDYKLYERYSQNAFSLMHDYWNYNLYKRCLNSFIDKASQAQ